jgi:hypothetical protein
MERLNYHGGREELHERSATKNWMECLRETFVQQWIENGYGRRSPIMQFFP